LRDDVDEDVVGLRVRLGDPGEDPDQLPLDVEEWLSWLATEKGRSPATLTAYRRDARRWWAWLRGNGLGLDGAD
jgi:hypothetical protein